MFVVNFCDAESSRFRSKKVNSIAVEALVPGVGNHNLHIGMIIFHHKDNTQSTGHNQVYEKNDKKTHKNVRAPIKPTSRLVIGDGNFSPVYSVPKTLNYMSSLNEIEPHTSITTQPGKSK